MLTISVEKIFEMNEIQSSEFLSWVAVVTLLLLIHEILLYEFLLALGVVKLTKNEKEILEIREFSIYLVWYKMHKFLSLVFFSHALPENLPGVLQKGSEFTYF